MPPAAPGSLDEIEAKLRIIRQHYRMGRLPIQILHPLAAHLFRRPRQRPDGCQPPRLIIGVLIQGRHIDPRHLGKTQQKLCPAVPLLPARVICVHKPGHYGLPFADDEGIHRQGQRLGIKGSAGAARNHYGVLLPPGGGTGLHPAQP